MDIGIGMPNSVGGSTGAGLLEWARRADAAGFSTLATIGAVSYPTHEELTVLGAAGAVTERIRLMPNVMISPARSTAELAKQAATVDQLSGGRLTLGVGAGWRESDYRLTGRDFGDRGRLLDEQLRDLGRAWAGEALVEGARPVAMPTVQPGGVPLMIGGMTDATIRRVVEFGVGWTAGGAPPDAIRAFADQVRASWRAAGREGAPRIVALTYFALGDVEQASRAYLLDYYRPMGDMAELIAGTALRSPEAIRTAIAGFTDAGIDELILDPTTSDPDQVSRLAEAAL